MRRVAAILGFGLLYALGAAAGLALTQGDPDARRQFVQFYVAMIAVTAVPLLALLADRRRLAAQHAANAERLRAVVDGSREVIFETDAQGRWAFLNAAWVDLTGRAIADTLGTSFLSVIHPDDRQTALDALGPLNAGEVDLATFEVRFMRADGTPRRAAARAHLRREDGVVVGAGGTLYDVTEAHAARAAAAEREAAYRLLADHSGDMIIRLGLDGMRRYVSPACHALLGYSSEEMLDITPVAAIHPDDRARVVEVARSLVEGVESPIVTYRQQNRDGHYVWLEATYRLVRDAAGEPVEIVSTVRDVSRREAAEREAAVAAADLHESHRLFAMAAEIAGVGHWRADLVNGEVVWSDEVYRIYGVPEDFQPTPRAAFDAFHPDDRARVDEAGRRVAKDGAPFDFEARLRRPDGLWRVVAVRGQAETSPDGAVIGVLGVVQDVTDRIESEARYRLLADSVSDIIVRLDLDDRCTYASPSIVEITGFTPEEAVGSDLIGLMHREDRDMVRARNDALRAGRVDRIVIEYRTRHKDGRWLWLEARSRLVRDADRRPKEIVSVVRDISERKALEAELRAARDAAEAGLEAKSTFVATMSHEIRTPMTGVLGMIELLRTDPAPAERERFFDSLEQSAKTLMAVLDDVLDFSKIESGGLAIEAVDFDLGALTRAVVDVYRNAASAQGLTLDLTPVDPARAIVRGDPTRLRQVLSNFIGNAIKFTPAGGISVSVAPTAGDGWRFAVRDTGIGIEAEAQARLFAPFTQADATTTRRYGGTGLGLSICKRLVEAMDGTIGVNSSPGAGSTFWFELELPHGDPAAMERDKAPATAPEATRALDVLVAEDNVINQLLITGLLRRLGHKVTCVDNGRLAVEAVAAARYDMVLMDMQMPEMDGVEATRAIRAMGGAMAALPIVALTADALPERRGQYEGIGLTDFLTKPVDVGKLQQALGHVGRTVAAPAPLRAEPAPAATPLLDFERIAALRGDVGPEVVNRLLGMMRDDAPARAGRIRDAVVAGDFVEASRGAHALRGAAASIGALRLAEVGDTIEFKLTPDNADALLADLDAAVAGTCAALSEAVAA